jgi:hypothetical protein
MNSRAGRIAVICAALAVAVVLFVALRGGDDDGGGTQPASTPAEQTQAEAPTQPPQPQTDVIRMSDGAPVGGVQQLTYTTGDQVRIEVKLDEPQEEIHLHGYEIVKPNPSGTVVLAFPATIEGVFELEAHGPGGDVPLAEITVEPA